MKQKEFETELRDEMNKLFMDEIVFNQNDAAKMLDVFSNVITKCLLKGDFVRIPRVGALSVKARKCSDPVTREPLNCNVLKFATSEVIKKRIKEEM